MNSARLYIWEVCIRGTDLYHYQDMVIVVKLIIASRQNYYYCCCRRFVSDEANPVFYMVYVQEPIEFFYIQQLNRY